MLDWGYIIPLVGLGLGAVIFIEGQLEERRWKREAEEERKRAGTPAE